MDRNATHFPDGSFAAPRHVANIDDIPESHRDWYEPHNGGPKAFRLKQHIWAQFKEYIEQIETVERETTEGIAKLDARLAASKLARHTERVMAALSASLAAANTPTTLIRGAASILLEQHHWEIETGYDDEAVISADTPFGLQSVDGLVENFLESEDGAGFRPKKTAPSDGFFTSMIAQMKMRR
ncbi:hypothetical protein [Mesorhizobium sp. CN2-181]|uniref:hypothetical protein n=1 Tax=Mesorhizobium yinganensis TaxID=3157707 RepID=UPI0032B874EE